MTSRIAIVALMALSAAPLAAQGGRGGRGGGGRALNADTLTSLYNLSAEQKTKTIDLLKTYNDKTAVTQAWLRSEQLASATRNADSVKKVTDARAEFDAAFKAMLLGAQVAKFDSIQALRGRRGGGGGGS